MLSSFALGLECRHGHAAVACTSKLNVIRHLNVLRPAAVLRPEHLIDGIRHLLSGDEAFVEIIGRNHGVVP